MCYVLYILSAEPNIGPGWFAGPSDQSALSGKEGQPSFALPSFLLPGSAMLCYAMLCYAMLCYAMLSYAILC